MRPGFKRLGLGLLVIALTDALLWATTTPVPQGVKGPQRDPADVPHYNDAARRVMEAAGIRINDLYAFAQPRLARIQIPQNVHFTPAGSAELADPVARDIQALRQRRSDVSRDLPSPASPNRNEFAAREKWVKTHLDSHGDRLPFTFQFDGRASTELLKRWPVQFPSPRNIEQSSSVGGRTWRRIPESADLGMKFGISSHVGGELSLSRRTGRRARSHRRPRLVRGTSARSRR